MSTQQGHDGREDSLPYVVVTADPDLARRVAISGKAEALPGTRLCVVMAHLRHNEAVGVVASLNQQHGDGKFSKQAIDPA